MPRVNLQCKTLLRGNTRTVADVACAIALQEELEGVTIAEYIRDSIQDREDVLRLTLRSFKGIENYSVTITKDSGGAYDGESWSYRLYGIVYQKRGAM